MEFEPCGVCIQCTDVTIWSLGKCVSSSRASLLLTVKMFKIRHKKSTLLYGGFKLSK